MLIKLISLSNVHVVGTLFIFVETSHSYASISPYCIWLFVVFRVSQFLVFCIDRRFFRFVFFYSLFLFIGWKSLILFLTIHTFRTESVVTRLIYQKCNAKKYIRTKECSDFTRIVRVHGHKICSQHKFLKTC